MAKNKQNPRFSSVLEILEEAPLEDTLADIALSSDIPLPIADPLQVACSQKRLLEVSYHSLKDGSKRRRIIGPFCLYRDRGSIFLLAQDQEDLVTKVFTVKQIDAAQVLDLPFSREAENPDEKTPEPTDDPCSEKIEEVTLKFFQPAASYVSQQIWHSSQCLVESNQDYIILQFSLTIDSELLRWVLSFGKDVKILQPDSLKLEILTHVETMRRYYQEVD